MFYEGSLKVSRKHVLYMARRNMNVLDSFFTVFLSRKDTTIIKKNPTNESKHSFVFFGGFRTYTWYQTRIIARTVNNDFVPCSTLRVLTLVLGRRKFKILCCIGTTPTWIKMYLEESWVKQWPTIWIIASRVQHQIPPHIFLYREETWANLIFRKRMRSSLVRMRSSL
jgi:hypothetical protein